VRISRSFDTTIDIGDGAYFAEGTRIRLMQPGVHVAIGDGAFINWRTLIAAKVSIDIGAGTHIAWNVSLYRQ